MGGTLNNESTKQLRCLGTDNSLNFLGGGGGGKTSTGTKPKTLHEIYLICPDFESMLPRLCIIDTCIIQLFI